MKKIFLLTVIMAMLSASSAYAAITASKHNLGWQGSAVANRNVYTTNTTEVCVFCHTPHGGASSAPLWNRQMATAGAYTPYSSSTLDATVGQPDGISLACLSCHDGTIALDALTNQPGSGAIISGTTASAGWTFTGLGTSTNNSLPEDGRITNLTQILSDDHPISMTYPIAPGGGIIGTGDPKFYAPTGSTATARWFEEATGTTGRADDNEVKLYLTGGTGTNFKVQCATCHNPHGTTAASGTPAQNVTSYGDYTTFLRKSNSTSALCTTCHIK